MTWGFYGRQDELRLLEEILGRGRWFFAKITGRRRIGKTTLIQHALPASGRRIFYVQIPDSAPAGVLSAVADALETFQIEPALVPPPTSLRELARAIGTLARAGYVVALDEFQYVNRERLQELCSHLQQEVDELAADAAHVPGGLLVLGSIQTEINALLEDRSAPLYNRTTDEISLGHLDVESLISLVSAHAEPTPERLLFLWNLFEGVPKFYRDCTEIDLVALDETDERIRFGTCKRSETKLVADVAAFDGHIARFLDHHPRYRSWTIERASIAPTISAPVRATLSAAGHVVQDLGDLTRELRR